MPHLLAAPLLSVSLPPLADAVPVLAVIGFVFSLCIVYSGIRDKMKAQDDDTPQR